MSMDVPVFKFGQETVSQFQVDGTGPAREECECERSTDKLAQICLKNNNQSRGHESSSFWSRMTVRMSKFSLSLNFPRLLPAVSRITARTFSTGRNTEKKKLKTYSGMPLEENREYNGEKSRHEILSMMHGFNPRDASQASVEYTTHTGEKRLMPHQAHKDIERSHSFKSGGEVLHEMGKNSSSSGNVNEELKKKYGEDAACLITRLTHQSMAQSLNLELLQNSDVNPVITGEIGETQVATPKQHRISYDVIKKGGNFEISTKIVFVCRDQQKLEQLFMAEEKDLRSATLGYIAVQRKVVISADEIPKIDQWKDITDSNMAQKQFPSLRVQDRISPFRQQADIAERMV